MQNVDFKSQPMNLIVYLKCCHVKYTDNSSILYLDTFSVHCAVKSHVLYTLVNLATYECTFSTFVNLTTNLYTFRIFVQKNTTFMQNVDFKSDL